MHYKCDRIEQLFHLKRMFIQRTETVEWNEVVEKFKDPV
jgi:hypothetical protein